MSDDCIERRCGAPKYAGQPIAEIVQRAHEEGVAAALGDGASTGLDRGVLERVLIYCAEKRCVDDGVSCPGCRVRTDAEALATLDDFCARFSRITARDSGLSIAGGCGEDELSIATLDALSRSWSGEEYWFWARRVLRKVRYGVRRAETLFGAEIADETGPAIILMEPQIAENVGMVARAMANFGLDEMIVVNPRDGWPSEKARAVASGAAAIVDGASVTTSLAGAMAGFHYVVATTARQRDMRKPILTPEGAAAELRTRIDQGQRCAILFGRERNGLESDEVAACNAVVMIPVNPKFASLNLAQAVLLLGYAWLRSGEAATLGRVTSRERRISAGLHLGHDAPAKHEELEGFFAHLEQALDEAGFFHPPERRHVTTRNLRSMFLRLGPTNQEVRTLRGIVATLTRRRNRGGDSSH